jgi:hypothetical protein
MMADSRILAASALSEGSEKFEAHSGLLSRTSVEDPDFDQNQAETQSNVALM